MGIHRKEGKIRGIRMLDLGFHDEAFARYPDDIILMVLNERSTRKRVNAKSIHVCGFENHKVRYFTRDQYPRGRNARDDTCTDFPLLLVKLKLCTEENG